MCPYFFFFFILLHSSCLLDHILREIYFVEHRVFILKHIFLSTLNVGVEYFFNGRRHVLAYSRCRNSLYMWRVCDPDNFLNKGQQNLTKLNAGIRNIILEVLSSNH
jgi:hypothetical protein